MRGRYQLCSVQHFAFIACESLSSSEKDESHRKKSVISVGRHAHKLAKVATLEQGSELGDAAIRNPLMSKQPGHQSVCLIKFICKESAD
jgi:hypothetical protein